MKLLAEKSRKHEKDKEKSSPLKGIAANTLRIARLKMLFIAAKVVKDQNRDKVKYSIHDARTPAMMNFLDYLDNLRLSPRLWEDNSSWPQRLAVAT
jgi:hypothetical protein